MPIYPIFALILLFWQHVLADEIMSLSNVERPDHARFAWEPGTMIVLPNGTVTIIEEELPSGFLRASDGTVITRDGKVKETEEAVKPFRQAKPEIGGRVQLPQGKEDVIIEKLPDGSFATKSGLIIAPDGKVRSKIDYVATFEEAEKLLEQAGKSGPKKQDIDMIADLLAFTKLDEAAGKNKGKPDKRQKPPQRQKPAAPAKKGDKLIIPPGAAAKNDFSFLKGCWRSKDLTYYDNYTPHKETAELCFNGGKSGSFISYLDKVCKAGATAKFNSGVLMIQAGQGPCQAGSRYTYTLPRVFQCEGEGASTECYILAKDPNIKSRRFKSRARFYKK